MVMSFAVALLLAPPDYTFKPAPLCLVVSVAPRPKGYLFRVLVSLNQLLNAATGGEPDETLSSRWGRNRSKSKAARVACSVLDHVQPCHCATSIERGPDGAPLAHQLHR